MNELINAELIEKTYLFCLKRVSDSETAKDLAHDILCAAISAAKNKCGIKNFYAWYWRLARNKYADHLRRKKDPALPIDCAGGIASGCPDPAETLVAEQELSALNFCLSRLAAVQRELVIRFYLQEQTVEQIAAELDIPAGTVKYRLFEARKNVRERFDNMSNFGRSSYAPAYINWFFGYGAMKAHEVMTNKIAQQTVVICRSEPVSVNEISDEIGVAPVYLEQVLDDMEKAALIKKQGRDKYCVNHCVFPMQAYVDAKYEAYREFRGGNYCERLTEQLLGLKDRITALPFYGNDFDYSYLMWILYVYAADEFGIAARNKYLEKYSDKYPDETERSYRFTANYYFPDESINWHDIKSAGWSNLHQTFDTPNILEYVNDFEAEPFPCEGEGYLGCGRDTWVNFGNVTLLEALAEDSCKPLSECELEQAAGLSSHGLVEKSGGGLKVMLPIIDREVFAEIVKMIKDAVRADAEEYSERVGGRVEKLLLPYVRRDLMSNFIHWDMRMFFQPTSYLFHYGIYESDVLSKPADYSRSAAGLWIKRTYRNKK